MTNRPLHLGSIDSAGVLSVPLPFDEFVRRERDDLFGALCVIVGDRDRAEELALGAFATVRERWDRVQDMDRPVRYLRRVAMTGFRRRCRRLPDRVTLRRRAAFVLTELWGYGDAEAARALGVRRSSFTAMSRRGGDTPTERDDDLRAVLERALATVGPAALDTHGIEQVRRRRRRRETVASLGIALALAAGVVAAARPPSEAARVSVVAVHRSELVDLRQILLPGSATPLGTRFLSRGNGVATLLGDVPAATGLARRASSVRFVEPQAPPLREASLEAWAVEYDSPVAAQAAMSVLALSLHFDRGMVDSRPAVLPGADGALRFVDRSIPRSVAYLWRHERLLLRLVAGGNLPPRDVRPIALAMEVRAVAATR